MENAAYGSTICAEGNAISSAIAAGSRGPFEIWVACIDADRLEDAMPCGNCRQIMSEFGVEALPVTIDGSVTERYTFDEILPNRFEL